ncbi:MAG TPA: ammonium transporter [Urbifossiella sp.]|nr:ammonium transporter [Urbifossiella sp.]
MLLRLLLAVAFTGLIGTSSFAEDSPKEDPAKTPAMKADLEPIAKDVADIKAVGIHKYGDSAWLLVSSAFVMLMVPGLALFYGGMARRKHVLGTMMQSMVALGLVGVQWAIIGYSLAFGEPAAKTSISSDDKGEAIKASIIGYSPELVCLSPDAAIGKSADDVLKEKKIDPKTATDDQKKAAEEESAKASRFKTFPNTNIPLYLHAMFQGMFAILTVALVTGAFAERVKFGAYCIFALLWTTIVYDPLAHWVWAFEWIKPDPKAAAFPASGLLGANGAIDFAGGTVVHIAAGFSGLAAVLLLRKRVGYGKHPFHPNSMVFTLLGAGLLWFGWFGFNGGSALYANGQAVSAFAVTQIAAAAAGVAWLFTEWAIKGKPTALGFASGVVAGLVAITPASGYVAPGGALAIGIAAGIICYAAVLLKGVLGYDDSLDAFGVHGIGGFLGAVLTGVFVNLALWSYGAELSVDLFPGKLNSAKDAIDRAAQIEWQTIAACVSAVYAFCVTSVLVLLIDKTIGFTIKPEEEVEGLDLAVHGEVGMDYGGGAPDEIPGIAVEPKAAAMPPNGPLSKRFTVTVEGANADQLVKAWSDLCKPSDKPHDPAFNAVYPYFTTMSGNKFRFRGGDPTLLSTELQKLLSKILNAPVKTQLEA